jgi:hypothetical protein
VLSLAESRRPDAINAIGILRVLTPEEREERERAIEQAKVSKQPPSELRLPDKKKG